MKSLSLSLVINAGIPWCLINLSKSMWPSSSAVYVSLNGIISVYLVSLSTMTSITSYFCFVITSLDAGSFVTKSILISC